MFHVYPFLRAVQLVNGSNCVFLSLYGICVAHALLFGIMSSMELNPTPRAPPRSILLNPVQSTNRSDYSTRAFASGYFNTTTAIDAIQFKMNSGNIDSGTIKLYGIKDS